MATKNANTKTPRKTMAQQVKEQRAKKEANTPTPMGLTSIPEIVASASLPDETKEANAAKSAMEKTRDMSMNDALIMPKKQDNTPFTFTSDIVESEEEKQEREVNTVVFINPTVYRDNPAFEHIEVYFQGDNATVRAKIMLHEKGITRNTRYVGKCRVNAKGQCFAFRLDMSENEKEEVAQWVTLAYEKRLVGLQLLLKGETDENGLPVFVNGYNAGKRAKYLPLVTAFAENAKKRKEAKGQDMSKVTTMPHTLKSIKNYED